MYSSKPLNLFYSEPDPDRWFPFDRYPRKLIRRIIRGKSRPGGVATVALNLMRGLDKIGVPYRINDYKYIKKNPQEIACIIGKPHVLFEHKWNNPILFGAGIYSHPIECPDLFTKYPQVKRFLVPSEWMRKMCEPYYHDKVVAWPVGIDTETWSTNLKDKATFDFLIYDKIRWEYDAYHTSLITPLCKTLDERSLSYQFIKYGNYSHQELVEKLKHCKSVIFLCEHETQGQAYQQILSTNTPILAWDRGGYWQDPHYYPKIKYSPVSSVPYWDDRCGLKFSSIADFDYQLSAFLDRLPTFSPRNYILENLTLEKCAEEYCKIHELVNRELN